MLAKAALIAFAWAGVSANLPEKPSRAARAQARANISPSPGSAQSIGGAAAAAAANRHRLRAIRSGSGRSSSPNGASPSRSARRRSSRPIPIRRRVARAIEDRSKIAAGESPTSARIRAEPSGRPFSASRTASLAPRCWMSRPPTASGRMIPSGAAGHHRVEIKIRLSRRERVNQGEAGLARAPRRRDRRGRRAARRARVVRAREIDRDSIGLARQRRLQSGRRKGRDDEKGAHRQVSARIGRTLFRINTTVKQNFTLFRHPALTRPRRRRRLAPRDAHDRSQIRPMV